MLGQRPRAQWEEQSLWPQLEADINHRLRPGSARGCLHGLENFLTLPQNPHFSNGGPNNDHLPSGMVPSWPREGTSAASLLPSDAGQRGTWARDRGTSVPKRSNQLHFCQNNSPSSCCWLLPRPLPPLPSTPAGISWSLAITPLSSLL